MKYSSKSVNHSFDETAQVFNSVEMYEAMYKRSIENPNEFWLEQAEALNWISKPTVAGQYTWNSDKRIIHHTWFEDGQLNVTINCLDRHLKMGNGDKPAIIWQGESNDESLTLTYQQLYEKVCQFSNVLKAQGICKGDRVCIYMPMIPEAAIATLACARIGAIHTVVFGGFSAESLSHRLNDTSSRLLITSNVSLRGGKIIPLKEVTDEALKHSSSVQKVIVVKRNSLPCAMQEKRDVWYGDEMKNASLECPAEVMNAEDPLFILYTSGSTGKPKGVVHTQGGYLLHVALSHRYVFDLRENDIYWCTADLGWITGHSYVIYGPLCNGSTTLMYEGIPTYPDEGRFWQIVEKYGVSIFYTAPTAIRALIRLGDEAPKKYNLSSLRILGSVGEPINPETWKWYHQIIGRKKCPVVDTWWQTETGGIMITPLPRCYPLKPGSASRPFFGVDPIVLQDNLEKGSEKEGGSLCIRQPWPGIMRTIWGNHDFFIDNYFGRYQNVYFTGDGCQIDKEGDYWLQGRIDDVVNISGHRIGTAEVESALVSHPLVAEAAVVPIPHEVKGQALYAYVSLLEGYKEAENLKLELMAQVKKEIGAIAIPEKIRFAKALPKTRSGKIMRRILRKIAENNVEDLGDISTLADPQVIQELLDKEEKTF